MPTSNHSGALPLWLLFPGTNDEPEVLLDYSGLRPFTEKHSIAFAAFEGLPQQGNKRYFNIGLHAQPLPDEPDDVAFVSQVVDEILKWPCIDQRRVHCAGFSNGGRFCMLVASELSKKVASVATVAGLRYPEPNHAVRSMPILAFHGTADPTNPWAGNGNPAYWKDSVIAAFSKWAVFNDCKIPTHGSPWHRITEHVSKSELNEDCRDGATVELVKLDGAQHTWPGAAGALATHSYRRPGFLGVCNREISANEMMRDFFDRHHLPRSMLPASVLTELQAKNSEATTVTNKRAPTDKPRHTPPAPDKASSGRHVEIQKRGSTEKTFMQGHFTPIITGVLGLSSLTLFWFLARRYQTSCRCRPFTGAGVESENGESETVTVLIRQESTPREATALSDELQHQLLSGEGGHAE